MPVISYQLASRLCAATFGTIAVTLLIVPDLIYGLFLLAPSETGDVMAKRAAMLFVGLASLMLFTSGHETSRTRTAIAASVTLALAGLLVLGILEWLRGAVGHGIWIAICAEALLALLLLQSDRAERRIALAATGPDEASS